MKQSRRHHRPECKREAVALVVEHGDSCAAAGRHLGVSGTLVRRWKVELGGKKGESFPGNGHRTAEQQRIHALETENRRLRMEREILKKDGLLCQGPRMRYRFIDEHKKAWPVTLMCGVLGVSRSGYYDWAERDLRACLLSNIMLDRRIREIFFTHRQRYGAPRMVEALHETGIPCSENRVARRMRALGLQAIQAKKFTVTTDSTHSKPVPPDLIEQDFHAVAPNQKWISDISNVWTDEGWLYLAVVMDLYSRAIVGWSMARRMTQQLVCDALIMALFPRGFPTHTIIHSDSGSQYCSYRYQQLIKSHGLCGSMGRRATCYDNAVTESFFHTLKVELVHRERYVTRRMAQSSIFEYIETYYNRQRKHSAIGHQIPMVFEKTA